MTKTLTWKRTTSPVMAGEYVESTVTVPALISSDGRFKITRTGTMSYRRSSGIRGPLVNKFRWTGYRLDDANGIGRRYTTVRSAKIAAEGRAKRSLA